MFTGLVDDIGVVERVSPGAAGRELRIQCRYNDIVPGESIAVSGACLTVRECGPNWFTTAAVVTTLERTTIGDTQPGTRVNLERSLRLGDRLGGHLVQGHVDGVGVVLRVTNQEDARLVDLALPPWLAELTVQHGSISVDGVSLTINDLPGDDVVQLSLIEYTLRHTTLGELKPDSRVNIEADMMGRYAVRAAQRAATQLTADS